MRGIGKLARESGLSVSALLFYDGAGILVPARVDPRSSYRWYSDDQVVAARLIARLRRVGLPLADVGRLLAHRRDPSAVEQILGAHLTRLEDGLADARREFFHARALLDQESPVTTQPPAVQRAPGQLGPVPRLRAARPRPGGRRRSPPRGCPGRSAAGPGPRQRSRTARRCPAAHR